MVIHWVHGTNENNGETPLTNIDTKQLLLIAALALGVCLVVQCWPEIAGFLGIVGMALSSIAVGFAFAFIGNIPMRVIERRIDAMNPGPRLQSLKRPISLTLALAFLVVLMALLLVLIVPQFAESIILLQQRIPEYIAALEGKISTEFLESLRGFIATSTGTQGEDLNPENALSMLANAGGVVGNLVGGIVGFASSAVSIVMSALLSIALLAEKELFRDFGLKLCNTYLGERKTEGVLHVFSVFYRTFQGFVVKQTADALTLGVLLAVVMLILGLPYASAVSTLVGLSALIPLIGVYVGMILGALLVFASSPIQALIFLVVAFVLIQVEASFISPRITETALGIPGVWVLICITVFGAIWGIMGILVGVPTFAALYRLVQEDMDRRAENKLEAAAVAP